MVFKKRSWDDTVEQQPLLWEEGSAVLTGRPDLPQVRHERMVDYQAKHNRSSHVQHIKVQATSQGATEHLKSTSMTSDVMRTHPRKAFWGKLIVQSGEYLMDIDRSLRKKLFDKATANGEDPYNRPSFAEQGPQGTYCNMILRKKRLQSMCLLILLQTLE